MGSVRIRYRRVIDGTDKGNTSVHNIRPVDTFDSTGGRQWSDPASFTAYRTCRTRVPDAESAFQILQVFRDFPRRHVQPVQADIRAGNTVVVARSLFGRPT